MSTTATETGSWSPQIPYGQADFIISLEPSEAVRLLSTYGNSQVKVLSNTRPIHSVDVIAGEAKYPSIEEIMTSIEEMVADSWFIAATEEAMKMGNPIYGNIIVLGALSGTDAVPMDRDIFKTVVENSFPKAALEANLQAYDLGIELVQ